MSGHKTPMPDRAGHKVLMMLSSSMPHTNSGYTVRSHEIASHLLRHGVDLEVYTKPGYPMTSFTGPLPVSLQDVVDGVPYSRIPLYPMGMGEFGEAYREQASALIASVATRRQARIIHAASDMENGLPAMEAAKKAGCKGIYEYRGMWHYSTASQNKWFPQTEPFQRRQRLELETGHLADAVFAISEALKRELVEAGLAESKITVLPNAVDTRRFIPLPPDGEIQERYGLKGRRVIGFAGSLTIYEGLENLIDAVLELNWRGEPVSLLIVGDGVQKQRLQSWHSARGSHPAIIFTGRVPFSEVNRYYSVMDVMPFPRIDAKVCQCVPPLKPLEAMAMRKAVLVSDVAALKEIVRDGETGLVCRADDLASLVEQLARLASSPALCERLAGNALEWVRRERDWSIVSKTIVQVYDSFTR
jgi:glycosyltransferase involved in cell wall biosynthesis